ncbi:zinc-ribbon domain containing protein [Candidatus Gottesmanbacteria bacterium]|nr:zinc-ribbon domain containing protein [Candidatus Gottesmanbacteria bacterium]
MADITQTCTQCGKKFLIIDQEQEFLKKKTLPLPTLCPTDRQARRLAGRGERTLYKTTCNKCKARVITSYDPAHATSAILCMKCYLAYFETHEMVTS